MSEGDRVDAESQNANGLARQPSKSNLFGPVMVACGARVIKRGCHVGGDVHPVFPPIVVDGAQGMQRRERTMYEAGERVKLGRLTGDEVTFEVGSKSVHRPPTAQAASTKPDEDTDKSVSMSNGVVSAADETLDGTRRRFQNWRLPLTALTPSLMPQHRARCTVKCCPKMNSESEGKPRMLCLWHHLTQPPRPALIAAVRHCGTPDPADRAATASVAAAITCGT